MDRPRVSPNNPDDLRRGILAVTDASAHGVGHHSRMAKALIAQRLLSLAEQDQPAFDQVMTQFSDVSERVFRTVIHCTEPDRTSLINQWAQTCNRVFQSHDAAMHGLTSLSQDQRLDIGVSSPLRTAIPEIIIAMGPPEDREVATAIIQRLAKTEHGFAFSGIGSVKRAATWERTHPGVVVSHHGLSLVAGHKGSAEGIAMAVLGKHPQRETIEAARLVNNTQGVRRDTQAILEAILAYDQACHQETNAHPGAYQASKSWRIRAERAMRADPMTWVLGVPPHRGDAVLETLIRPFAVKAPQALLPWAHNGKDRFDNRFIRGLLRDIAEHDPDIAWSYMSGQDDRRILVRPEDVPTATRIIRSQPRYAESMIGCPWIGLGMSSNDEMAFGMLLGDMMASHVRPEQAVADHRGWDSEFHRSMVIAACGHTPDIDALCHYGRELRPNPALIASMSDTGRQVLSTMALRDSMAEDDAHRRAAIRAEARRSRGAQWLSAIAQHSQ